jgi:hypothetical protein
MWCATFWECSECGGRIECRRPPALCQECGTAGVIFVPLDDPNDEIDVLGESARWMVQRAPVRAPSQCS